MSAYTVDYFIETLSAIEEQKWCCDTQLNESGQRCAYGHCRASGLEVEDAFEELDHRFTAKLKLTWIGKDVHQQSSKLADINNGYYKEYQQPSPKQRTITALKDIKKLINP
jgi:hypothetical protein